MTNSNTRKWLPLLTTNFLGVFNDNVLKHAIIFIAIGWNLPSWLNTSQIISAASAALVLPYILLSPLGGKLAVHYSKTKVFSFFKFIEIPIVLLAGFAFYIQNISLALLSVLLMGIQSCLYSPAKYSLIRDIGGQKEVAHGTGMFEAMAFLGVLIGTVVASFISDNYNFIILLGLLSLLALAGFLSSKRIKVTEEKEDKTQDIQLNPIQFIISSYQFAKKHTWLNTAVLGSASFWLIGSVMQMNLIIHSKNIYFFSNTQTGALMAMAAVAIAFGSIVAGRLLNKIGYRNQISMALLAIVVSFGLMAFLPMHQLLYIVLVFIAAFAGGLFQIPCISIVQKAEIGRRLGDMMAYLNLITFIFLLIGTAMFSVITALSNENSNYVFFALAIIGLLLMLHFGKKIKEK
jgi:MFS family permease